MEVLRTPEERFHHVPDFPYAPHYCEVPSGDGSFLRLAYIDEGPRQADPVLLLHGEPSWSFLYRQPMAVLLAAGHRVVAPDLIGFGRSDKPVERSDYTYARHVLWLESWMEAIDLSGITLLCQDWGGLLGLRLLAAHPKRFKRCVAANTMLPTGDYDPGEAFLAWRKFSQTTPDFQVGRIVAKGCAQGLSESILAAYDAPFPDDRYKAGARQFPNLVPITPDDPESAANRAAWEQLRRLDLPFLTAFGDQDPITRGADRVLRQLIPGTKGMPHCTLEGAGHFLQEDAGIRLGEIVRDFIAATPR